jgi:aspartokinase-like uncharacterized kinase
VSPGAGGAVTVVKVGGGLARELGDGALRRLCLEIATVAAEHQVLVVPGGAEFADAVRDYDRRFGLSPACAHKMALLAMDQFGMVLGELIPGAWPCADPRQVTARSSAGRAAVLAPVAQALDGAALPASWEVTSDSIALWAAAAAGGRRAVLVKAVDGLYREWPERGKAPAVLTAAELGRLQREGGCAGVDRYFPAALRTTGVQTWVVGAACPGRLVELLESGTTVGTRLTA